MYSRTSVAELTTTNNTSFINLKFVGGIKGNNLRTDLNAHTRKILTPTITPLKHDT